MGGRKRGSILAEMCIAILVLAVVLLGIMAAFTMSVNSMVAVKNTESSMFIATAVINELEGVSFADMSEYRAKSIDFPLGYNGTVVLNPTNPNKDTTKVGITVSVGRSGSSNRVTMSREVSGYAATNSAISN